MTFDRVAGKTRGVMCAAGLLLALPLLTDAAYVPYPGKLQANAVNVESARTVTVNLETWPGFARNFRVTIPGIDIPSDSASVPDCERELAARALAFSRERVLGAKALFVQDMRMESSAAEDALSPILTEQGSLAAQLIDAGLARLDSVDPKEPWCK